jgi:hypothetical protein
VEELSRTYACGGLNLDHQTPATLRDSRCCDDQGSHNDEHTSEYPGLGESCRVQDLAGNWGTDQQADGDDCGIALAMKSV